jgi:hypothetical protein
MSMFEIPPAPKKMEAYDAAADLRSFMNWVNGLITTKDGRDVIGAGSERIPPNQMAFAKSVTRALSEEASVKLPPLPYDGQRYGTYLHAVQNELETLRKKNEGLYEMIVEGCKQISL